VLCSSDGVDGYLARRHGATNLGAFLDPLADKILVLGAMAILVSNDTFWIVPVAITVARELLISLYRTFVGAKGVSVPASKIAKWKTFVQQLAVGFAIMPPTAFDAKWLWNGLLWIIGGARADQRWPVRLPGDEVRPAAGADTPPETDFSL
jgi:CDP-diacylglycerol--glycerol-3-phosphate 3-phosphatidyltransferase